jgi:signal transduction histidine kinase
MKPKFSLIYSLTLIWAFLIFCIGIWWLYLIKTLSSKIPAQTFVGLNIPKIIFWEGATFFILMMILTSTLAWLILRDRRKNLSLKAFFASMTHELKTPLASIKLQAEVLHETYEKKAHNEVKKLLERILEDTSKLEGQMDNILQLSRVEMGGQLSLIAISLKDIMKENTSPFYPLAEFTLPTDDHIVLIEPFAFSLCLKNIFYNGLSHGQIELPAKIHFNLKVVNFPDHIELQVSNNGKSFKGKIPELMNIFYKYDSPHGTGIGLYLVGRLMQAMEGKAQVISASPFTLCLSIKKANDRE